jgi:hypothetical protein
VPDVDKQNKNPSRFSRVPGAKAIGRATQDLIYVGSRISLETLEAWLGPDAAPEEKAPKIALPATKRLLKGTTKYFLDFGAQPGRWNRSLYLAALDMARAGLDESVIYDKLEGVTGRLDASDKRTIASALRTARTE